jgi:hypothetical protein
MACFCRLLKLAENVGYQKWIGAIYRYCHESDEPPKLEVASSVLEGLTAVCYILAASV